MHWLKLECRLLFGGLSTKLALALIVVCAVVAIHLGEQNYQQLRHDQTTTTIKFEQQMAAFKQQDKLPEAGYLGYYVFAPTQWQLSPWTILFAGQSQSAYAAMPIRALALQGQIHNREVVNPSQQKAGQFDLGFVLIYLLPLVLGVLSVTLLSDERQSGRWQMLSAMKQGGVRLLSIRLALILSTLLILGASLLLLAALWLSLPIDGQLLWLMVALALYLLFWTCVIALIISFAKGAVFNTLSFMSLWLLICLFIPASIQLYLDHRYQDQPALQATLEQRMVMNDGWDQDKQAAMSQFKQTYPQYQQFELPQGNGSWHWYYAQQQVSDQAVGVQWQAHLIQLQQRANSLNQLSLLSPSLMLQLAVNRMAGSGGEQHLAYIKQVAEHHRDIREYLYPYLFADKLVTPAAIDAYPRFNPAPISTNLRFSPLAVIAVLLMLALYFLIARGRKVPLICAD